LIKYARRYLPTREIVEEGVAVTAKVAEWVVSRPVGSSDWLARGPATSEGMAAQG
jgi:hypothetical protein